MAETTDWREVERKADLERQFMISAWKLCDWLSSAMVTDFSKISESGKPHLVAMLQAFDRLEDAGGPRP